MAAYADAGLRTEACSPISLRDAAETAFWNLKKSVDAAQATVSWEGEDVVVQAPERDVLEVIGRLVDNAVKFGGRNVEVRVSAQSAGDSTILSVQDSGPGIEGTYAGSLFTPFQRLHGKQYPGHGLGLAICRKIVEGKGGTIRIDPEYTAGARLLVTFPR
jgi:K+-sensing histidine kinase KdpD